MPSQLINVHGKKPTTQIECAKTCKYKYLDKNLHIGNVKEEMSECIERMYGLQPGSTKSCDCPLHDGKRCASAEACSNRLAGICCGDSCGTECQNNPWRDHSFAMERGKLFLHWIEGKEWCLFALEPIKKFEFIGEYTGRVYPFQRFSSMRQNYTFNLDESKHVIDAYEHGSALRLINNECYPCCKAALYIHEHEYKVVFYAIKNIKPGQEITINYGWTVPKNEPRYRCNCKHPKCLGWLEMLEEDADALPMPRTFQNVYLEATFEKKKMLDGKVQLNAYDPTYQEDHLHGVAEPVAAIVLLDGNLTIMRGFVVECYKNKSGFSIYLVKIEASGTVYYHLPIWFVFRHIEVAEVRLKWVFTTLEKSDMKKYLSRYQTKRNADKIIAELVPEYVEKIRTNTMPETHVIRRGIQGTAALGVPLIELRIVEHTPDSSNRLLPRHHSASHTKQPRSAVDVPSYLFDYPGIFGNQVSCQNSPNTIVERSSSRSPFHPITLPEPAQINDVGDSDEDNDAEEDDQHDVTSKDNGYDPHNVGNLLTIVNDNRNTAFLDRQLHQTIETLVFFMKRRLPTLQSLDYLECKKKIGGYVENCYYASPAKDRQFLDFYHYKVANEAYAPGSSKWLWCSLCGTSTTFANHDEFREHYNQNHAMCAKSYNCKNGNRCFTFPSELRKHTKICDPASSYMFPMELPSYMLDSLADFVALRTENDTMLHVLEPGLPANDKTGQKNVHTIQMDKNSRKPVDTSIPTIQTNYCVQKTYKLVDLADPFEYLMPEEQIVPIIPSSSVKRVLRSASQTTKSKTDQATRYRNPITGRLETRECAQQPQQNASGPITGSSLTTATRNVQRTIGTGSQARNVTEAQPTANTLPRSKRMKF